MTVQDQPQEQQLEQKLSKKERLLLELKGKNRFILIAVIVFLAIIVILAITFFILFKDARDKLVYGGILPPVSKDGVVFPQSKVKTAPISKLVVRPTSIPKFVATPTPRPTPRPLPFGPQSYSVSSNNVIKVVDLTINPLTTKVGDSQSVSLTIQDAQGKIVSVSVKMITDNKSQTNALAQTSVSSVEEIWQGSWKEIDSHDYTYQAQITIKDDKGNIYGFVPSFR